MAAAANLPLHMLLSMKRTPLHYIFGTSYEGKLNHIHQGLGKIIYLLLSTHVGLYLKFFWDTSRMRTRLLEFDTLCGVAGFVFLVIPLSNIIPQTPNISNYRTEHNHDSFISWGSEVLLPNLLHCSHHVLPTPIPPALLPRLPSTTVPASFVSILYIRQTPPHHHPCEHNSDDPPPLTRYPQPLHLTS